MRPDGSDPSGDFVVEWFRVPEDRAALELPTSFASSTWDDYPFIEKIGELRKSRVWVRGTEALAVPAMEPPGRCGAPELWLFGFPAGAEGCETDPITGECLECGPMAIGQEVATAEGVDDGNLQQEVATAESADQWATTGIAAEVADAFGADSVLSPALPFVGMAFGLLAGELAYAVATAEAIDAGHTRVEVDSVASAFGADVDLVQREPAASEAFGTVCSIETIGIGAAEAFAVGTGDLFPRQAIAATAGGAAVPPKLEDLVAASAEAATGPPRATWIGAAATAEAATSPPATSRWYPAAEAFGITGPLAEATWAPVAEAFAILGGTVGRVGIDPATYVVAVAAPPATGHWGAAASAEAIGADSAGWVQRWAASAEAATSPPARASWYPVASAEAATSPPARASGYAGASAEAATSPPARASWYPAASAEGVSPRADPRAAWSPAATASLCNDGQHLWMPVWKATAG